MTKIRKRRKRAPPRTALKLIRRIEDPGVRAILAGLGHDVPDEFLDPSNPAVQLLFEALFHRRAHQDPAGKEFFPFTRQKELLSQRLFALDHDFFLTLGRLIKWWGNHEGRPRDNFQLRQMIQLKLAIQGRSVTMAELRKRLGCDGGDTEDKRLRRWANAIGLNVSDTK